MHVMMMDGNHESRESPTQLLRRARGTDAPAAQELFHMVYGELHGLAEGYMRRERADHTLQPTMLVHDAFMRLIDQSDVTWDDRGHFYALAARCMRQLLVDHARRKNAAKRGGGWDRILLSDILGSEGLTTENMLELDDALSRLAKRDDRAAQVVELRFFGGMSLADAAKFLGVARSTAESDWSFARAWLGRELASN